MNGEAPERECDLKKNTNLLNNNSGLNKDKKIKKKFQLSIFTITSYSN